MPLTCRVGSKLADVYVTSGNDTEQLLTLEAMVQVANALTDAAGSEDQSVDMRRVLDDAGFSKAAIAPEAAIRRTAERCADLLPRLVSLPVIDVETATLWTNAELTELAISPSLTDHGGGALHIHWTPASATFDDQVIADFLMALANELCDNGTKRFGTCAADDCNRLFYDSSRNGSRRFCSDPRCASRTHTADHRKRKQQS
jgi:predicted RNA-binding Zn ribbon-like protein